jgi:hypothetical protein
MWLTTGFWLPESKFYYTDINDISREMPIAFTLTGDTKFINEKWTRLT